MANYLRDCPLNLLTGTPPPFSIVVAEVTVLRFRKYSFCGRCWIVFIYSASMAREVLSAMAGTTGFEAGFGACFLRFLGTGASSN
jgi:hypothetical protein